MSKVHILIWWISIFDNKMLLVLLYHFGGDMSLHFFVLSSGTYSVSIPFWRWYHLTTIFSPKWKFRSSVKSHIEIWNLVISSISSFLQVRPEDILRPQMLRPSGSGGQQSADQSMEVLLQDQLFKHHCAIALNPPEHVQNAEDAERKLLEEQHRHISWLHKQAGEWVGIKTVFFLINS